MLETKVYGHTKKNIAEMKSNKTEENSHLITDQSQRGRKGERE